MSHVLITGCSSGFGFLTALRFAREGHHVFATVRNRAKAIALDEVIAVEELPIDILDLDICDARAVTAAVAQAEVAGPIDVLINNAGIEVRGPVEECDDETVRRQFETNVFGTLRMLRAVLPAMRGRRAGTIVNLSSVAGLVARPFGGLYSASKHAIEAVTEALHFEVKPFGIRVVLVEPGQYATHLLDNMYTAPRFTEKSPYWDSSQRFDTAVQRLAADGEPADPQEVADVIYHAVFDRQPRLRYLAGADATMVATASRQMSFEDFERSMRSTMNWWD